VVREPAPEAGRTRGERRGCSPAMGGAPRRTAKPAPAQGSRVRPALPSCKRRLPGSEATDNR
jgi:hypothetical protein